MTSKRKASVCAFCHTATIDDLNLGKLKAMGPNISVHYYCVLLSSTITQSGKDNQGLEGFLLQDIRTELQNRERSICRYCNKPFANLKCSKSKCKAFFHLPCGLKHKTLHEFYGNYRTYCHQHVARQRFTIPTEVRNTFGDVSCPICQEIIPLKADEMDLLIPQCCRKTTLHIKCIKQLALNAGYFTKCPICNNTDKFVGYIKSCGVFVPDRDASWELERNAFNELTIAYKRCDAKTCKCRKGGKRQYSRESGPWEIVRCYTCGGSGIHKSCNNNSDRYICSVCIRVDSNSSDEDEQTNSESEHVDIEAIDDSTTFEITKPTQPEAILIDDDSDEYFDASSAPFTETADKKLLNTTEIHENVKTLETEIVVLDSDDDDVPPKPDNKRINISSGSESDNDDVVRSPPRKQRMLAIKSTARSNLNTFKTMCRRPIVSFRSEVQCRNIVYDEETFSEELCDTTLTLNDEKPCHPSKGCACQDCTKYMERKRKLAVIEAYVDAPKNNLAAGYCKMNSPSPYTFVKEARFIVLPDETIVQVLPKQFGDYVKLERKVRILDEDAVTQRSKELFPRWYPDCSPQKMKLLVKSNEDMHVPVRRIVKLDF